MNCFTCQNNLSAYIDDELTADVRREVEAHLDACEVCRKEYETYLAAWELAGNMRTEAAPEHLWQAIEAALQQRTGGTSTDDLALIVRGLASEVRDLKQTVEALRHDLEAADETRRRSGLGIWTEPGVGRTRSQMG